ncbi:MAG: phosphoglucosamine mutase [Chloracidobacterium sp. CP2_5A]|nr:MAG: phosphoglucosamine mutase [Chloracidobacterium sp. CP2_5A]
MATTCRGASAAAVRITWPSSESPATSCKTFGRRDFRRAPSPAAKMAMVTGMDKAMTPRHNSRLARTFPPNYKFLGKADAIPARNRMAPTRPDGKDMRRFFGTDGIRGRAGAFPLQPEALSVIGATLTSVFFLRARRAPRFVIGGDTRESSPWIAAALAQGIAQAGGTVSCAGVIPTPGVAYLTRAEGFDAGIVVSASHNPYHDNGIKFFLASGEKRDDDLETAIEVALDALPPAPPTADAPDAPPLWEDPTHALSYLEFLTQRIAADLDLSRWRLALDCANGAAAPYANIMLQALGAQTCVTGATPTGRNINDQRGTTHIRHLAEFARATDAQLGIAFDGDADRCLFVDEQGEVVDGDAILYAMALDADARSELSPRCVVTTVMSNMGLEVALRERGIELIRTPVGDRAVLAAMLERGALLGGEQSGHIIFARQSLAGDGLITALNVLRMLTERNLSLREAVRGLARFPQTLINVPVREKRPFETLPGLAATVRDVEAQLAGRGRLLLRYSGTENLARVMLEAANGIDIGALAAQVAAAIARDLGNGRP